MGIVICGIGRGVNAAEGGQARIAGPYVSPGLYGREEYSPYGAAMCPARGGLLVPASAPYPMPPAGPRAHAEDAAGIPNPTIAAIEITNSYIARLLTVILRNRTGKRTSSMNFTTKYHETAIAESPRVR